ncbi:MAG: archease [Candidatus Thermoplasmatota archaeon]|nr:archease [Candidatus Thermoplasmatota archaeon]MBU1940868.1 archease [Candidatus Thermoplasmatota archaeon]
MKAYEFIDHTADVVVKAYGKDIAEAYGHAAKAMFDLMTDSSKIAAVGEYKIELTAPDREQLLVDWLSELLFLHDVHNVVFGRFKVVLKDNQLSAIVYGEEFSTQKHRIGIEIKAVTYHMLEVHMTDPVYVQVLFDI